MHIETNSLLNSPEGLTVEFKSSFSKKVIQTLCAVNMVIHKDYTHHGNSSVNVYDNKIEFFNPGSFAAEIIPDKILQNDYNSGCRNKHILGLFKTREKQKDKQMNCN